MALYGYGEASKVIFGFGKKKKKDKKTKRTKDIEEQLRKAGFSEADIRRFQKKKKR